MDNMNHLNYEQLRNQLEQSENRVKQLEEQIIMFQEVLNSLNSPIYWKSLNGIYMGCNTQMLTLYGKKSMNEIIGHNDFDLTTEDMANLHREHDQEVIETGIPLSIDEDTITAKNEKLHFISTKSPLFLNQKTLGTIGVSIDITERKKLELELRDKKNQLEKRLAFQKHYIKSYGYDYISALKLISESIENIEVRLMQLDIPQTVRSDLNDEFYQVNESLSEIYTLYQKINTAVLQQDERAKIVTVESTLEEIIENEVGLANTFISSDLKTKVTYQIKPLAQQKLLIDYAKLRHIIRTFLANFTNSVNAQNSHDINLTVTAKAGLRSNTLYVTFSFDGGTPFLEIEGDTIRAEHLLNHSLNHIPGSKHSLAYELALAKSYIELLCDGEELNDATLDPQQLSFTLPFKKVYYEDKAPKLTAIINEMSD